MTEGRGSATTLKGLTRALFGKLLEFPKKTQGCLFKKNCDQGGSSVFLEDILLYFLTSQDHFGCLALDMWAIFKLST